jgi:hypothetical protein
VSGPEEAQASTREMLGREAAGRARYPRRPSSHLAPWLRRGVHRGGACFRWGWSRFGWGRCYERGRTTIPPCVSKGGVSMGEGGELPGTQSPFSRHAAGGDEERTDGEAGLPCAKAGWAPRCPTPDRRRWPRRKAIPSSRPGHATLHTWTWQWSGNRGPSSPCWHGWQCSLGGAEMGSSDAHGHVLVTAPPGVVAPAPVHSPTPALGKKELGCGVDDGVRRGCCHC